MTENFMIQICPWFNHFSNWPTIWYLLPIFSFHYYAWYFAILRQQNTQNQWNYDVEQGKNMKKKMRNKKATGSHPNCKLFDCVISGTNYIDWNNFLLWLVLFVLFLSLIHALSNQNNAQRMPKNYKIEKRWKD